MPIKVTTESFIAKAQTIHGDKYNYDLVEYKNNRTKVKISCPEHGIFEQSPDNHLAGKGCRYCSVTAIKTTESFIERAREHHGDKYDYSLTVYTGSKNKVKINCHTHGIYEQRASHHLNGSGCAKCANEASGWTRSGFKQKCAKNNNGLGILYVLECFNENEHFFKIGITSRSIKKRYPTTKEMPYAYSVVKEIIGDSEFIYDLETEIHQQHRQYQYTPEVAFKGNTECFKQIDVLAYILARIETNKLYILNTNTKGDN